MTAACVERRGGTAAAVLAALCAAAFVPAAAQPSRTSPFDLSLEELGAVRVQSVSRRGATRSLAPAAVYVITAEEIRRSGVTNIPEALRLAPGVEVAQNSAHEWTISIRGFSSDLSNKLLVLINGRSVYSPLYAGVFWDAQDTLLADIERIEIVAGPGGAVWGANAVNGVINIITHSSSDTLGTHAEAGAGDELESLLALAHGWERGPGRYARAFVKHFSRDATERLDGSSGDDAWQMLRAGFSMEWEPADDVNRVNFRAQVYTADHDTLAQSDFTLGTLPTTFPGKVEISGYHALASWRRTLETDATLSLQIYFDHTEREIPGVFAEDRDTLSASLQHDMVDRGRHNLIWGIDARTTSDSIDNTTFASFMPASRTDDTLSAFVSDDIGFLDDRVVLTLGEKIEHNDYSGFENQPSARVAWLPDTRHTIWSAVSRAIRIPARLETDLDLLSPISAPQLGFPLLYVNVRGNPDFQSEKLTAYEAGYRFMPNESVAFDVAVFDNYYDRLQTTEIDGLQQITGPPDYALLTAHIGNLREGETYGGSAVMSWQMRPNWRWQFQYTRIELDLAAKPGGTDSPANLAGSSPRHQYAARAYVQLPHGVSLYSGLRYVDELPGQGVPSYLALDLNAAWQISEHLRASLTLTNANDARHVEFGDNRVIERAALLRVLWSR